MSKLGEHAGSARIVSAARRESCMADDERQRLLRLAQQTQRLLVEVRARQARFQQLLDVTHELACTRASDTA